MIDLGDANEKVEILLVLSHLRLRNKCKINVEKRLSINALSLHQGPENSTNSCCTIARRSGYFSAIVNITVAAIIEY